MEEAAPSPPPSPQEHWLLKLLLLYDDVVPWAADHLDPNWLQHPLARRIVCQRMTAHTNQTWTTLAAFLHQCSEPEMQDLITEVAAEERPLPNPAQQLADVALKLRNRFIDSQMAALLVRLNQPTASEEERLQLSRQREQLRLRKREQLAALAT